MPGELVHNRSLLKSWQQHNNNRRNLGTSGRLVNLFENIKEEASKPGNQIIQITDDEFEGEARAISSFLNKQHKSGNIPSFLILDLSKVKTHDELTLGQKLQRFVP
ncbi:MAG: hypothetical protein HRT47_12260 [Candidatus Caenarcaniphilales bacterium]|nr:hypothetical protein [Candidatus Caenarcaniphilales bacterium]